MQDDLAIALIREFAPVDEPLYVAFSGGKDSIVLLDLVRRAGVPHTACYNNTTIDPPELTHYIRTEYPTVIWVPPLRPFFKGLLSRGFPTRKNRWCCHELKEERVENAKIVALGVRAEESPGRRKRKQVEACHFRPGVRYVNPILDWSNEDVWSYIRDRKLPYCSLYDEGWSRIGCVFCVRASQETRIRQAERWPRHVEAFRRAFNRLYAKRIASPRAGPTWKHFASGDELFDWWLYFKPPASRLAEAAARAAAEEEPEEPARIFLSNDDD